MTKLRLSLPSSVLLLISFLVSGWLLTQAEPALTTPRNVDLDHRGSLEHADNTLITFGPKRLRKDPEGSFLRWRSITAHEYVHA